MILFLLSLIALVAKSALSALIALVASVASVAKSAVSDFKAWSVSFECLASSAYSACFALPLSTA